MADETIFITNKNIPLLLHDNGDGTYSLAVQAELSATPTIDIGDVTLLAGTALIGKVGIDQVTANANEIVLKASEAHVGKTTGSSINIEVTPTITGGAYSALDTIGGIQTLANASRIAGEPTTLQTLIISDLAMVSPNFRLWFFKSNPAAGNYADNGALDIHDTDAALCVGVLNGADGQWVNALDNGFFEFRNIGLTMTPTATSLFVVIETVDAETFITTSDLKFIYGFFRG